MTNLMKVIIISHDALFCLNTLDVHQSKLISAVLNVLTSYSLFLEYINGLGIVSSYAVVALFFVACCICLIANTKIIITVLLC